MSETCLSNSKVFVFFSKLCLKIQYVQNNLSDPVVRFISILCFIELVNNILLTTYSNYVNILVPEGYPSVSLTFLGLNLALIMKIL